jgi:nitrous oxidase accessory protein NosD
LTPCGERKVLNTGRRGSHLSVPVREAVVTGSRFRRTGQTTSERLARINTIATVIELEVDESGKLSSTSWEWK